MPLSKQFRAMQRMPMFPVMPLLPLALMAAAITLGLASYRRLKTLDEKLDHVLEIAGTPARRLPIRDGAKATQRGAK